MIQELKSRTMKNITGRIILGVIALIIIAAIFVPSIIKMITGPKDLQTVPLNSLEGVYVQGDVYAIYDNFYYYTEDSNGIQQIDINYYTIPIGDEEFCTIALKDDFYKAETLYNDTYDYFNGDIDEINSTFSVTGTFEKMSNDIYKTYIEVFTDNGYTQEEIDRLALPYILVVGQIGNFDSVAIYIAIAASALILLFILYNAGLAITSSNLSNIKKLVNEMGSANGEERLEADYQGGFAAEKDLRIGHLFTFFTLGTKAYALKNSDIVWAYLERVTHRVYGIKTAVNKSLIIYDINKKKYMIPMKKQENVLSALDYYSQTQSNIVLGFNDELKKCFKKDFDQFLTLAKSQYEERQNAENVNTDTYNTDTYNTEAQNAEVSNTENFPAKETNK